MEISTIPTKYIIPAEEVINQELKHGEKVVASFSVCSINGVKSLVINYRENGVCLQMASGDMDVINKSYGRTVMETCTVVPDKIIWFSYVISETTPAILTVGRRIYANRSMMTLYDEDGTKLGLLENQRPPCGSRRYTLTVELPIQIKIGSNPKCWCRPLDPTVWTSHGDIFITPVTLPIRLDAHQKNPKMSHTPQLRSELRLSKVLQYIAKELPKDLEFHCPDGVFRTSKLLWMGRFDSTGEFKPPLTTQFSTKTMEELLWVYVGCCEESDVNLEVMEAAEFYVLEFPDWFMRRLVDKTVAKTPREYINHPNQYLRKESWDRMRREKAAKLDWYGEIKEEYCAEFLKYLSSS